MIRIVNWLLTRKCNLKCEYCAIVKNYDNKPAEYPDMKYYHFNEMDTDSIIESLRKFKFHNPDIFHIFYGGEPMLRKDLPDIINYCNSQDIHYTIISNNTPEVQPMILNLLEKTGRVEGFTASVDPVFNEKSEDDRVIKSVHGLKNLISLKKHVSDVVAEITVMKHNVAYLYDLVRQLTDEGINSDITFIDIAKNQYYDFSNITDHNLLVPPSAKLAEQFSMIMDQNLDVHMKDILLPAMWDNLPSNMDCEIDKNLHNISIDADGTIRLCLSIRGSKTPQNISIQNLLNDDGEINNLVNLTINEDKKAMCELCNHTCHIMSWTIDQMDSSSDDLVHLDRRKNLNYGG